MHRNMVLFACVRAFYILYIRARRQLPRPRFSSPQITRPQKTTKILSYIPAFLRASRACDANKIASAISAPKRTGGDVRSSATFEPRGRVRRKYLQQALLMIAHDLRASLACDANKIASTISAPKRTGGDVRSSATFEPRGRVRRENRQQACRMSTQDLPNRKAAFTRTPPT